MINFININEISVSYIWTQVHSVVYRANIRFTNLIRLPTTGRMSDLLQHDPFKVIGQKAV